MERFIVLSLCLDYKSYDYKSLLMIGYSIISLAPCSPSLSLCRCTYEQAHTFSTNVCRRYLWLNVNVLSHYIVLFIELTERQFRFTARFRLIDF